jgi:hypothetical protein
METSTKEQVVLEISRSFVSAIAPEELPLFRAQSEAYLQDPQKLNNRGKSKDEMLGFGVGETVTFLTPVVIAVTMEVFDYLMDELKKNLKSEGSAAISDMIKQMFKKSPNTPDMQENQPTIPQGKEGLNKIHTLVMDKARQMKLSENKANQLANAIIADLALSV